MNKFCRLLSELRPSNDEVRNQLVDREIELRASSNAEKEKLKKQLEISENENKRLRNERKMLKIRPCDIDTRFSSSIGGSTLD